MSVWIMSDAVQQKKKTSTMLSTTSFSSKKASDSVFPTSRCVATFSTYTSCFGIMSLTRDTIYFNAIVSYSPTTAIRRRHWAKSHKCMFPYECLIAGPCFSNDAQQGGKRRDRCQSCVVWGTNDCRCSHCEWNRQFHQQSLQSLQIGWWSVQLPCQWEYDNQAPVNGQQTRRCSPALHLHWKADVSAWHGTLASNVRSSAGLQQTAEDITDAVTECTGACHSS